MTDKGDEMRASDGEVRSKANDFNARLGRMMQATGAQSQRRLAAILGIRPSGVTDAKRRGSIPREWYLKLFSSHGLNPDWLETGNGPVRLKEAKDAPREDAGRSGSWALATIRSLSDPDGADLGQVPIPAEFNTSGLLVARMDGSRMEPSIRRGALVGIDLSNRALVAGEIHALKGPFGELHLHRVYNDGAEDNSLVLTCDNTGDAIRLNGRQAQDRAVGRVVWVMQAV